MYICILIYNNKKYNIYIVNMYFEFNICNEINKYNIIHILDI